MTLTASARVTVVNSVVNNAPLQTILLTVAVAPVAVFTAGPWTRLSTGLPEHEYNSILRDAASVDAAEPAGVYFGTRGGSVYASADEGGTFAEVASHLPDVLCVRAAVVAGA